MSESNTPIADFVARKREEQIGKFYQDADHARAVLIKLSEKYKDFHDKGGGKSSGISLMNIFERPDHYKLSHNQTVILAASLWLDRQGKEELYKLVRDNKKEKDRPGDGILLLDKVKNDVLKIAHDVRPDYNPTIVTSPRPPVPPRKTGERSQWQPLAPIDRATFLAEFDKLTTHAFTHTPYGVGRTIGLAKFFKLLRQHYRLDSSRDLAEAIVRANEERPFDAADIQRAIFNKCGGQDNAEKELYSLTQVQMNDPAGESAGKNFSSEPGKNMAAMIATFAFPDDADPRRPLCEEFLCSEKFEVPEAVVSERRSKASRLARQDPNWGKKRTGSSAGPEGASRS